MWERACSRKRFVSRHPSRLTLRLREQARSHIYNRVGRRVEANLILLKPIAVLARGVARRMRSANAPRIQGRSNSTAWPALTNGMAPCRAKHH